MNSSLSDLLKARLDALEDERDDLFDHMAHVAIDVTFCDRRFTAPFLREATEKLIAVTSQIPAIAAEWVRAVEKETGQNPVLTYALDMEWRKSRKFPRIQNSLLQVYDVVNPPR